MSSTTTTMGDNIAARLKSILRKSGSTQAVTADTAVAETAPVEPTSLARHIQSLIDNLPTPSRRTTVKDPKPPQRDENGRPIPPPTPIKDSKLIQLLSSATIMNGSRDKNSSRPSIWSILESLGASKHEEDSPEDVPRADPHHGDDNGPDIFSDTSSVMVYSPLLPARNSLVELAESEVIMEDEEVDEPEPVPAPPIPGWSWSSALPNSVTSWFSQTPPAPWLDDNGQPLTPRTRERRLRAQATRVWIPSKDKLSIQCMWWGYRMFLPPPVLDILNDKQLEAAKRAAMITTALTWFFNNLPINNLPLALRPTLLLLQRIAPFLGYIGTFISWSWSTIKSYDQGFGVILTATWLLPIALIPGTWFERDWPTSPIPPESTSLPPDPTPLQSPLPSPPTDNLALAPSRLLPTPSDPMQKCKSIPQLPPVPESWASSPASLSSPESPKMSPPPASEYSLAIPVVSPAGSSAAAVKPPGSSSPKRMHTGLANLVAKSPIIRARKPPKAKSSPSPASSQTPLPCSSSSQLTAGVTAYPSPTNTNQVSPITPSASTSTTTSMPISVPQPEEMQPSPPAHPNDLRLLQSPVWQCSPLPPEHAQHPVLPPETEESPKDQKKRRKGMRFLKSRK